MKTRALKKLSLILFLTLSPGLTPASPGGGARFSSKGMPARFSAGVLRATFQEFPNLLPNFGSLPMYQALAEGKAVEANNHLDWDFLLGPMLETAQEAPENFLMEAAAIMETEHMDLLSAGKVERFADHMAENESKIIEKMLEQFEAKTRELEETRERGESFDEDSFFNTLHLAAKAEALYGKPVAHSADVLQIAAQEAYDRYRADMGLEPTALSRAFREGKLKQLGIKGGGVPDPAPVSEPFRPEIEGEQHLLTWEGSDTRVSLDLTDSVLVVERRNTSGWKFVPLEWNFIQTTPSFLRLHFVGSDKIGYILEFKPNSPEEGAQFLIEERENPEKPIVPIGETLAFVPVDSVHPEPFPDPNAVTAQDTEGKGPGLRIKDPKRVAGNPHRKENSRGTELEGGHSYIPSLWALFILIMAGAILAGFLGSEFGFGPSF